jgi:hypothetical protein
MRRGAADRLVRDSALRPHDKLVMLALLCRADNEDCKIPAWRSPSLSAVERDTSLSHATVLKVIEHLEKHLWLARDGQRRGQLAGTKGAGRGRSATAWRLLPGDAPLDCNCPKPDRSARDQSRKQIGREATNLDWSDGEPESAGEAPDCTKGVREGGNGWDGYVRNPRSWE